MDYFDYVGGRKFLLAVLAIVLVSFVIPVDPQAKLDFVWKIVGFFLGANAISGIGQAICNKEEKKKK